MPLPMRRAKLPVQQLMPLVPLLLPRAKRRALRPMPLLLRPSRLLLSSKPERQSFSDSQRVTLAV